MQLRPSPSAALPFALLLPLVAAAQPEAVKPPTTETAVLAGLEAARTAAGFPGACAAWIERDGREGTVANGALKVSDRLMSGSIGKTYVAAVALRLVAAGKLDLDAKVGAYLDDAEWLARMPNGAAVTARHLLQHTSGIPEHVWKDTFQRALLADRDRTWSARDLLDFVAGDAPLFAPGAGWSYADTNFVLLGAVLEQRTGKPCFDLVRQELLEPLGLRDTAPNAQRRVQGLAVGHTSGVLGFEAGPVVVDGEYAVNPQFEYCGGGMSSTTLDLARWCRALYAGDVLAKELRTAMADGVPSKTGRGHRYGLGCMIVETPLGRALGHTGIMPGYLSIMLYYEKPQLAVAVQFNTDAMGKLGKSLQKHADAVADIVGQH